MVAFWTLVTPCVPRPKAVARLLVSDGSPKAIVWAAVLPLIGELQLAVDDRGADRAAAVGGLELRLKRARQICPSRTGGSWWWDRRPRPGRSVPSTVRAMLPAVMGVARLALASVWDVSTLPGHGGAERAGRGRPCGGRQALDRDLVLSRRRRWCAAVAVRTELSVEVALRLAPALVTVKFLIWRHDAVDGRAELPVCRLLRR